jgi:hypothetical protein
VTRSGRTIEAAAGPLALTLDLWPRGRESRLLGLRPRRLRTSPAWISVEDRVGRPLAAPLLGVGGHVRTTGVTRTGRREWYAIHDLRRADARATVGGVDLGQPAPCPPAGFGFSEFPAVPALVRVTSMFAPAPVPR